MVIDISPEFLSDNQGDRTILHLQADGGPCNLNPGRHFGFLFPGRFLRAVPGRFGSLPEGQGGKQNER